MYMVQVVKRITKNMYCNKLKLLGAVMSVLVLHFAVIAQDQHIHSGEENSY